MIDYEKIGLKAALCGHTAAEFHVAAQKNANATWVLLLAGSVTWYCAGWGWALIPCLLGAAAAALSVHTTLIATGIERWKR